MTAKAESWQMLVAQTEQQWRAILQEPYDEAFVHQARVTLRQLRSMLAAVKKVVPSQEYNAWQEEWRGMSQLLGALRQWDVLEESWRLIERELGDLVKPAWDCQQLRQKELERVRAQAALVLQKRMRARFQVWLEAHRRRVSCKQERKCVKKRLDKWAELLADLQKQEDYAAEQVHRCRIVGKKLRYALEMFFPNEAEKLVLSLKRWQALLGIAHDSEIHRRWLFSEQGKALLSVEQRAILLGWEAARAVQARKQAQESGGDVLRLYRQWRRGR